MAKLSNDYIRGRLFLRFPEHPINDIWLVGLIKC